MKRVTAVLLSLMIVILSVFSDVNYQRASAAVNYSVYYDDFSLYLTARCKDYQECLRDTGSKQFGLLYSMRIITQYSLYVDFMLKYYDDLGMSQKTVRVYERDLAKRWDDFNKKYGKSKTNSFKAYTMKHTFTGHYTQKNNTGNRKTTRTEIKKELCVNIPAYLKSMLKSVKDDITNASKNGKAKEEAEAKNTTLITNIYQVEEAMLDAEDDLASYVPFDKDGKQVPYKCNSDSKKMDDALKDAFKPYADLVRIAQKSMQDETDQEITVDLDKAYVDNLSNAQTSTQGVEIPVTAKLSLLYYAIMAASSTYVPLQSYAGSSQFQTALKSLTNDDEMQKQIVEFYSSVKDIRKPLYKRKLDDKGYPTGPAEIMTIQDLFDDIRSGNSGALCAVMGEFTYDASTGSWIYKQDTTRTTVEYDYDDVESSDDLELDDSAEDKSSDSSAEIAGGSAISTTQSNTTGEADPPQTSEVINPLKALASAIFPSTVASAKKKAKATAKPKDSKNKDTKATAKPDSDDSGESEDEEDTEASAKPEATEAPTETDDPNSALKDDASSEDSTSDTNASAAEPSSDPNTVKDAAVYAYSTVTDETKITEPLYFYGTDYLRDIDNMTSIILSNALTNAANLNYINDKKTRYIYTNAFGDIVTDDNLIILPGIANPLLYSTDADYNPYTAAFMNSYPLPAKKNSQFRLTNKNDIGKYLILRQKNSNGLANTGENTTDEDTAGNYGTYAVKTTSISTVDSDNPLVLKHMATKFSIDGKAEDEILGYNKLIFGSTDNWNEKNSLFSYTPLTSADSVQAEGVTIFPYLPTEDVKGSVAKAIAQNMFHYLTMDQKTGDESKISKFNDNYILHNFIISGLNGTNNPKGYSTNSLEQYEKFVSNSSDRFLSKLADLSQSILDYTSGVRGVIGLRESLQNPAFGRVLNFCRDNLLFLVLMLIVVLIYAFSKMKLDLPQLIFRLFLSVGIMYAMITVIPTYVPMLFNIVINNVSETLSYKTMAVKTENGIIDAGENEIDEDGTTKFNTNSVTLYRASALHYGDWLDQVNVDADEISAGDICVLDDQAGLFVEGDSLKISTDRLFDTLKIQGSTTEGDGETLHTLKTYKTVSNNVDYYTPYYPIVNSFVDKLNTFEKVAEVPRSTITYSNGFIKDNFLVYSYVNSNVFLTPGNYDMSIANVKNAEDANAAVNASSTATPKESKKHKKKTKASKGKASEKGTTQLNIVSDATELENIKNEADAYSKDLQKAFGDKNQAIDFLGISSWLYNPTDAMKTTLWYKTMLDQHYYRADGSVNEYKMDHLVSYVNFQTKKFIYSIDDQIGKFSDDTMIKMISMRALTALTQEVSQYGDWLYPFSLNYGDFTLQDVVGSCFISDYYQYTNCDLNVIDYIAHTKGWFTLIIFDVLIVILFVVVYVVQYLVYLVYVLLCIALLLKLLSHGDLKIPLKGFFKCFFIIMASYTLLTLAFAISNKFNGSAFCIYGVLLATVFVCYLLFVVISALIANWADVGNSAINVKVAGLTGGLSVGPNVASIFNRASFNNPLRRESNTVVNNYGESDYSNYSYSSSVDDLYNDYGGPDVYSSVHTSDSYSASAADTFDYSKEYDDLTSLSDDDFVEDLTASVNSTETDSEDLNSSSDETDNLLK